MAIRNALGTRGTIPYELRRIAGDYVRSLRDAAGLTQQQVGAYLGVYNTVLSAIESGRIAVAPERYGPLADVLRVDRKKFAKTLLKYYDPWMYDILYPGDAEVADIIRSIPPRSGSIQTEK